MLFRSLHRRAGRVVCVHAMQSSIPPTVRAFQKVWPEANLAHLMDDSIPQDVCDANGHVNDKEADERLKHLANYATYQLNANAIMFTCSAFVQNIHRVTRNLPIHVEGPTSAAVESVTGRTLVLSMFAPTLNSIYEEILQKHGDHVRCHKVYVPDALEQLQTGDPARCQETIVKYAYDCLERGKTRNKPYDCILLPMFSMAFAQDAVQEIAGPIPVISTPEKAVKKLRRMNLDPLHLNLQDDDQDDQQFRPPNSFDCPSELGSIKFQ